MNNSTKPHSYSLAEIRNGTGWPKGVRFVAETPDMLLATPATTEEIQRARDEYQNDDVEIDEGAEASHADGGVWVQAWVWLGDEELLATNCLEQLRQEKP